MAQAECACLPWNGHTWLCGDYCVLKRPTTCCNSAARRVNSLAEESVLSAPALACFAASETWMMLLAMSAPPCETWTMLPDSSRVVADCSSTALAMDC